MEEPINLFAPDIRADPYPSYARLRLGSAIQKVEPGGFWAVSRAEDVEYVLKNPQLFCAGFGPIFKPAWLPHNPLGDSMVTKDGPEHTQLRALVSHAFTPRAIARLEPRVRAICVDVAERLATIREGDLIDLLCAQVPARVIVDILGLDPRLHIELKRWMGHLVMVSPIYPGDAIASAIRSSLSELESNLKESVAARRREPCDDMVSDLVQAEVAGHTLTDDQIIAFLFLLGSAGFETTAHFFSNALLDFDRHPEAFTRLREDPSRIPAYVEELLRKEPPVHSTMRLTSADTELGGVKLPQGTMVMVLLASANHDESRFPAPERLDPSRGSRAGFTFGHGPHFCLGAPLARLEARVMLEELTARFVRFEKLPGDIEWNIAVHVRGPIALPFRAIPASDLPTT